MPTTDPCSVTPGDALGEILQDLRLARADYGRSGFTAPWANRMDPSLPALLDITASEVGVRTRHGHAAGQGMASGDSQAAPRARTQSSDRAIDVEEVL